MSAIVMQSGELLGLQKRLTEAEMLLSLLSGASREDGSAYIRDQDLNDRIDRFLEGGCDADK
jgi:hypothetical protein